MKRFIPFFLFFITGISCGNLAYASGSPSKSSNPNHVQILQNSTTSVILQEAINGSADWYSEFKNHPEQQRLKTKKRKRSSRKAKSKTSLKRGIQSSSRRNSQYTPPQSGATAVCRDGSYSYSRHRRGTCSHHGGVARWL